MDKLDCVPVWRDSTCHDIEVANHLGTKTTVEFRSSRTELVEI
jgi:hypothetical protein